MEDGLKKDEQPTTVIYNDSSKGEVFLFKSETEKGYGFQDFVEKNIGEVLGLKLCLFKEFPAGQGGSMDFLGIDDHGLIFLIEVKCEYDMRAKSVVIFQTFKYYLTPNDIYEKLFVSGKEVTLKPKYDDELRKTFPKTNVNQLTKQISANLSANRVNPIIVIDKATPQLISAAHTLVFRNTKAEFRIVEMSRATIAGSSYVFAKKYFTTNEWVSINIEDNRQPHLDQETRLKEMKDDMRRRAFESIITTLQSRKDLSFQWNTESMSYFNLLLRTPGQRTMTLGVYFYTRDHKHKPSGEKLIEGSIEFSALFDIAEVISKFNLQVKQKNWKSEKMTGYSFILVPEVVKELGPEKICDVIECFKDIYKEKQFKS